jgi:phage FluMu gp28-like protein
LAAVSLAPPPFKSEMLILKYNKRLISDLGRLSTAEKERECQIYYRTNNKALNAVAMMMHRDFFCFSSYCQVAYKKASRIFVIIIRLFDFTLKSSLKLAL